MAIISSLCHSVHGIYTQVSIERTLLVKEALKQQGVDIGFLDESHRGQLEIYPLEDKTTWQSGVEIVLYGTASDTLLNNLFLTPGWQGLIRSKCVKSLKIYNTDCLEGNTWALLLTGLLKCSLQNLELYYTNLPSPLLIQFLKQPTIKKSLQSLILQGQYLQEPSATWYKLFGELKRLTHMDLQGTQISFEAIHLLRNARIIPFEFISFACNPDPFKKFLETEPYFASLFPATEELDLSYCITGEIINARDKINCWKLFSLLSNIPHIKSIRFYQDYPIGRTLMVTKINESTAALFFFHNTQFATTQFTPLLSKEPLGPTIISNLFFNPLLLDKDLKQTSPSKPLANKQGLPIHKNIQALTINNKVMCNYTITAPNYDVSKRFLLREETNEIRSSLSGYLGHINRLTLNFDTTSDFQEKKEEHFQQANNLLKGSFIGVRELTLHYAPNTVVEDATEIVPSFFKYTLVSWLIERSLIRSLTSFTLDLKLPKLADKINFEEIDFNAQETYINPPDNVDLSNYLDVRFLCEKLLKNFKYLKTCRINLNGFSKYWSETDVLDKLLTTCLISPVPGLEMVSIEIGSNFNDLKEIAEDINKSLIRISEAVDALKNNHVFFQKIPCVYRKSSDMEAFCKKLPKVAIKFHLARNEQLKPFKNLLKPIPWFVSLQFITPN